MKPDLGEIAKITDYIVSYSCKGNITWQEQREQTKKFIMVADSLTNDKEEFKRISKQVLNKTASKRIISKQEAMALLAKQEEMAFLGDMPFVLCSETIETIPINNSQKLQLDGKSRTNKRFVSIYANRKAEVHHLSLHEFYIHTKNINKNDKKGKYKIRWLVR